MQTLAEDGRYGQFPVQTSHYLCEEKLEFDRMGRLEKSLRDHDLQLVSENLTGCNLNEKLDAFSWLSIYFKRAEGQSVHEQWNKALNWESEDIAAPVIPLIGCVALDK